MNSSISSLDLDDDTRANQVKQYGPLANNRSRTFNAPVAVTAEH